MTELTDTIEAALRLLAQPMAGPVALGLAVLLVLWLAFRRRGEVRALARAVESLGQGQQQLFGGLTQVAEAQAAAQARLTTGIERRLEEVGQRMGESLQGSAGQTARSLGALGERLAAIDRAQAKIERLSGDVLSLQEILSNKQTRGAFGEIQLAEIVAAALPPDAYALQVTLSNGRRADCLIRLARPPGPIVIDSKFPLEAYEALRAAEGERARAEAAKALRRALSAHIDAIAERYIVEGETADSALLFLPSEAVYAELHANHAETVRRGFAARVWIVSPTTCMAMLTTMRGVMKDARVEAEAGRIRRELGLLHKDVTRLAERADRLDGHFRQASQDLEQLRLSADKVGRRAGRLEAFEFGEGAPGEEHGGEHGARLPAAE